MRVNSIIPIVSIASLFILIGCNSIENKQDQSAGKQAPNIIYILADDLGYGDIGPFGQKIIQTPSLSKMAAEGMVLTQHYAGNTVCAPSRCSLISGLHPGHAWVRGNKQAEPHGQLPIPVGTVTVSGLLKQAGYSTGMIGKWGLGNTGTSGDPSNFGWDLSYGYNDQVLAHNYYPEYLIRNGIEEPLKNEVVYMPESHWSKGLGSYSTGKDEYSHDLFTVEALKFIESHKEEPFFLYLPYTIPHDNGEAPEDEKMEVPDFGIYADNEEWNKETKGYAAMISRMDGDIGKILELLVSLGIDQNTLVIFTSDNGPMPDQIFTDIFNSNGDLRGGKRDMYEGGIRSPFIAWWPEQIEAGSSSDHISAFWDFLPTVCEIAEIDIPAETDGISYLPVLLGEAQKPHDYLYWESPLNNICIAIRMENWKAVKLNYKEDSDSPFELYDLSGDIGETSNLASDHPEILEKMNAIFEEAHTPSKHFPFPSEI
jgi:arylsulfatase A